jgi:MoxR-like ATPase
MAYTVQSATVALLQLHTTVLHGAFKHFYPNDQWLGKAHAANMLAIDVADGRYTFDMVVDCPPLPLPTAGTVINVTPNAGDQMRDVLALEKALAPVRNAADNAARTALDASTRLSRAVDRLDVLEQGKTSNEVWIGNLEDQLRIIGREVANVAAQAGQIVDASVVAEQVTAAIRDAFKPFEEAVIAAGAQDVVGSMVAVSKVKTIPVSAAFGVAVLDMQGQELMVDIYDDQSAPAIDPSFIWTERILSHLLISQQTGDNLWFGGEKGTGKTETARQFAARTGRGFCRVNFQKYTTAEDFVGAVGLENGATVFKAGDFLQAFTSPATVILLDEPTNADPAALAILNGFLEPNSAVNYGGAVRRRAANVLVFAADNTMTNGDESGRYAGTRTMNSALADRFARVIAFKHLAMGDEIEAVVRHTGCTYALAEHVLKAVHACRAKVSSGDIIDAPSIRQVLAFIRSVNVLGVNEAWAASIGNRQPSESATAIEAIKAAFVSESFINNNI